MYSTLICKLAEHDLPLGWLAVKEMVTFCLVLSVMNDHCSQRYFVCGNERQQKLESKEKIFKSSKTSYNQSYMMREALV